MVITHVAVALLVTLPVAVLAPAFAIPAAAGAVVGAIIPDLDLFVGEHRRTLHFPVLGPALGAVATAVALVRPTPATVALAAATVGAGLHATSDVLGAGEELRPWERTNPYAVYDHVSGRWWRARYLIPYDGSPRDLLIAVLVALPSLEVYDGAVRWLLAGLLGVGAVYALVRRDVVPYVEELI